MIKCKLTNTTFTDHTVPRLSSNIKMQGIINSFYCLCNNINTHRQYSHIYFFFLSFLIYSKIQCGSHFF